ncbi:hypothetical protein [Brevundimonas balnearis]|uniref:Uncharacterized protein n=1 Tax=Brevundimonas balnearis TaxID=1572858 RepID=A0ABV6R0V8_9CAUL
MIRSTLRNLSGPQWARWSYALIQFAGMTVAALVLCLLIICIGA